MNSSEDSFIARFLKMEAAGGTLLVGAALLAILLANSPLYSYYTLLIDTPVEVKVGTLEIAKPLLLWVNDGLMALFFLLVGLELKREFLEGELSNKKKIVLPGLGAIGGMAVPAAIYILFNIDDPTALKGWAIPAATDIAFALGVLSVLGSKVPTSLKVFLTSLAIFDDIGAILIIAFFYTSKISFLALIIAFCCIVILYYFNKRGIVEKSLYLVVGIVMWVAMLKSGVHATLAGVMLAMFIPIKSDVDPSISPLKSMEHDLPFCQHLLFVMLASISKGLVWSTCSIVYHSVSLWACLSENKSAYLVCVGWG
jgi:NhaA family Na+:H+ antiporter